MYYTRVFSKHHYTTLLNGSNLPNPSPQTELLNLCKLGHLSESIQLLNSTEPHEISLKPVIFAALLQTCIKSHSFNHGLQFHSHVIKTGLESDRYVGNSLLSMYFKLSPDFSHTYRVFDNLFEKDVISWTSMISGYVQNGKPLQAIDMFWKMLEFGVEPNAFTLSSVIKACSELGNLRTGICFHGLVWRRGFDSNNYIVSSLIDMYGRNFSTEDARNLFDEMSPPDAICCTSLISAFTRNDFYEEALGLFYLMHRKYRLRPDGCTFGTVLTACGNLGRVKQGKEVHAKVVTLGFCGHLVVESSLLDMYGKCGLVGDSRGVFDRMRNKNAVSWCALLGTYCHNGEFGTVLDLFREMNIEDNMYSFGTVLRACAGLAVVRQGKEVHCQYLRKGGWRNVIVESALVDLYSKCGLVDYAHRMFLKNPVRNMITWNSMISGFAQNGRAEEAIRVFDEMINEGIKPDSISFIGVLSACSHAGLISKGKEYFQLMDKVYKINARIEHYNCMVDLLGRAGLIEEAEDLLKKSVFRNDLSAWATLLGACASHSNLDVAENIAKKMMDLEPESHISYVLLINIYKTVDQWDDALRIRKLMEERGVKKIPGKSWIDVNNKGSPLDLDDNGDLQENNVSAVGK